MKDFQPIRSSREIASDLLDATEKTMADRRAIDALRWAKVSGWVSILALVVAAGALLVSLQN